MKTSDKGISNIISEEAVRLTPYPDPVDVWTVGVGHKLLSTDYFPETGVTVQDVKFLLNQPKEYKPTWHITSSAVRVLLAHDVENVENFLNAFLRRNKLVITQNQFDALIDFGFNAGVGSLGTLLSHGLDQVPIQIVKWIHAGGEVLEGLVNRRNNELKLWNTPDSTE